LRTYIPAISIVLTLSAAGLFAACGGESSYSSPASATPITTAPTAATNVALPPTVKVAQSSSLGQVLTDSDGRTLYVYLKDVAGSGKSVCNGVCATAWPPLMSTSGQVVKPDGLPGSLSVITRDDGSTEVAYNGQPLYHYAADAAPGDTNGQAVGSVWYVVPPSTSAVAAPAPAKPTVKLAQAGALGQVLTDPDGRTLYMYSKDVAGSGKSVCNGACATAWPPLRSTSGQVVKPDGLPGSLSVITRDDGSKEVAYNGQPLYYYAADAAPGDTNGQGVGNVWHVVPASASASAGGSPDTAAASASSPAPVNAGAASTASGNSSSTAAVEAEPTKPAPTAAQAVPAATATSRVQPTARVEPTPYPTSVPYGGY
jgi:predicted lipoprotein with Yx(FWY)xxD motif